jgi:hypothetical protein
MNTNPSSWEGLLARRDGEELATRSFYLLKREGHELLAIPANHRDSPDAVALYLPQTWKARAGKTIFRLALTGPLAGLLPTRKVDLRKTDFTDFLCSLSDNHPPDFCVLSGNPAEPGRRFIFGLLDPDGKCCTIVKCAVDDTGCNLIEVETATLDALQDKFPAIPKIRAKLAVAGCQAFAMDFFGEPEQTLARAERIALASQWIWHDVSVPLESLTPWRAIAHPGLSTVGAMVNPVVFHGDFAPWNIRRSGNQWMVIDWEKASPYGPPLWD